MNIFSQNASIGPLEKQIGTQKQLIHRITYLFVLLLLYHFFFFFFFDGGEGNFIILMLIFPLQFYDQQLVSIEWYSPSILFFFPYVVESKKRVFLLCNIVTNEII